MVSGQKYEASEVEEAYQDWRHTASLRKSATRLDIPFATLVSWSRSQDWMARRLLDDDKDKDLVVQQARLRLVGEVDKLLDNLLVLALHSENERLQFSATKYALELAGLRPVDNSSKTTVTVEQQGPKLILGRQTMTEEQREMMSVRLLGIEPEKVIDITSSEDDGGLDNDEDTD